MAFKVFITFVWFFATALVVFSLLETAHSQLDLLSKTVLFGVGIFAEAFVSCLFVEGIVDR